MLNTIALICFLTALMCKYFAQGEIYAINIKSEFYFEEFEDMPANFGGRLSDGAIRGALVNATPTLDACKKLNPPPNIENVVKKWIVLIARYTEQENCTFEKKVRNAQAAGYDAAIIYNVHSEQLVPMSAQNSTGIFIPSVFVSESSGLLLEAMYTNISQYFIVITGESPFNIQTHLLIPFAIVVGICFLVMIIFMIVKFIKDRRRQRRHRLPTSTLNKIPTCKYQKGDPYETCAICLDDFIEGEKLRVLPCNHVYHTKCIDPWLTKNRRVCPICKRKVFAHDEPHTNDTDSDSDADDTAPLISSSNRGTQGGTFVQQTENPIQRAARSISQQSGATNHNLVTASDHHSINGEYQSIPSEEEDDSDTDSDDEIHNSGHVCDNLEVHVHVNAETNQREQENTDLNV